jgi:hypothetical protein
MKQNAGSSHSLNPASCICLKTRAATFF